MRKILSRIFIASGVVASMSFAAMSQDIQVDVLSNLDNEKLILSSIEEEKQGGMTMNAA